MKYLFVILFILCQSHPIISKEVVSINTTKLLTIFFQFNTTNYRDSLSAKRYKNEYTAMKEIMDANPEITLVIHGFQNTKEDRNLSKRRAQKVQEDLIKAGLAKDKMIIKNEPSISIDQSITDNERELTQKVSFTVMKQTE